MKKRGMTAEAIATTILVLILAGAVMYVIFQRLRGI